MGGAADGGLMAQLIGFAPIIGIFILFYFLLIRPQQKRAKGTRRRHRRGQARRHRRSGQRHDR